MGILKHLLFWPVTGPLFLADFSLGKVQGVVRDELTDDGRVKAGLLELQLKLELGDIDDEQYLVEEAALMQQLRDVRHWREQFGMAVSGGPVRVQSTEPIVPDTVESDAAGDSEETSDQGGPHVADPGTASIELNLDWD
jgi:hypothetical protein